MYTATNPALPFCEGRKVERKTDKNQKWKRKVISGYLYIRIPTLTN